jgi:hypothetical protein
MIDFPEVETKEGEEVVDVVDLRLRGNTLWQELSKLDA